MTAPAEFHGRELAARARRARILLLRDVPEEERYSMERYANELENRFSDSERFEVSGFAVHQPNVAARLGLGLLDGYFARFLHYPAGAARRSADLYHVIDQGYAYVGAFLPPNRTIVTCHDLFLLVAAERFQHLRGRPTSVVRFRWTTSYLRKVAHVVCVSATSRDDAVRICRIPRDRISVIPNGISERFRPLGEEPAQLRQQLIRAGQRAVLHVSSGMSYKNVPATLAVVASLRRAGLDVVLVRAGVPLSSDERAQAQDLGVAEVILECGRVSDDRLVELYNACDVLLFPSYYEGFGWPPLEAMACGTPVVTSTFPAIREVVGDAGLAADADDVAALAGHVGAILDSPDLAARLRERGKERAAQFTWRRAIERYAEVYERVLECAG